jgi:phosphoadenosine phosphosulfate reductase
MEYAAMEALALLDLAGKVVKAKEIIGAALARFGADNMALAVTGGKDSTLMLGLFREVGALPELIFIDEGDGFVEINDQMERLKKEWGISVTVLRNDDLLGSGRALGEKVLVADLSEENRAELLKLDFSGEEFPFDPESPEGNHLTKTVPLKAYLRASGKTALATAIRWDEHESRLSEEFESPREDPAHTRVHPLLHFAERDIWDATFAREIPFCALYRQGYRSLGTKSGTVRNDDVPAWEQDLENTPERAGRGQDKEAAMEQLRALGYM